MFKKATTKSNVTVARRVIDPATAQDVLDHTAKSNFPQRQLSGGTVDNYAREMKNGTWHSGTADVVRLSKYKGGLAVVDGQHRLAAVAKSGKSQTMWVAENVPPAAFKYIDQGRPRALNHVMHAAGWPSPTVLAAAGRFLLEHKKGSVGLFNKGSNVAPGTMFDRIKEELPDLKETWETYGKVIKKAANRCVLAPQAMLMFFYLAEAVDHDASVRLITWLADSYASEPCDPIFRLMTARLDANAAEFRTAKDLGREVRTEIRMADQFQVLRFSWLVHTGSISSKPKTVQGFNKAHNKWVNNGGSAAPWAL